MTKQEWIAQARGHADDLRALVSEWHPTYVLGAKRSHNHPITAPNAESACRAVRSKIAVEQEMKPDPVKRFDIALAAGDWAEVSGLLSDAWFGVPESTTCWQIRGFAAAVDLMDDPPEDEIVEGELVEEEGLKTMTPTIAHFPTCHADYPEKPITESPRQLSSMGIGNGETVYSCNDCGAFVVLDRNGKEIARS